MADFNVDFSDFFGAAPSFGGEVSFGDGGGGSDTRGSDSSSFGGTDTSAGGGTRGGGDAYGSSGGRDSNPGFAGGGYVGDNPDDDYTVDPMQFVQSALDYGRRKITAGGDQMSFDEGGVVPEQGMGNPNAIDPQAAMAYLAGDGAVSPEIAQALEQRIDPQGQMNPTQRAMTAIGVAPSDEARFGMLQHYRTKFNGFAAAAKAAMARGDQGEAARQATMALDAVPNGEHTQLAPAPGGFAVVSRPAIAKRGRTRSYADGGEVLSDADPLYDESGAVVAPPAPEPPPLDGEILPPEPAVMSDAEQEPMVQLAEDGEPVQVAGMFEPWKGGPKAGASYSTIPANEHPNHPTYTAVENDVYDMSKPNERQRYREDNRRGRFADMITPLQGYAVNPEELLLDPGRTSGPVGAPGPSGKAGYRDAEGNIMLPGATEPMYRRTPAGYQYNDSAGTAPRYPESGGVPGGGTVGAGIVPDNGGVIPTTPRRAPMPAPGGSAPMGRTMSVPPPRTAPAWGPQPQPQQPQQPQFPPVTGAVSPAAQPASRLRQPGSIDVGRGVRRQREGY